MTCLRDARLLTLRAFSAGAEARGSPPLPSPDHTSSYLVNDASLSRSRSRSTIQHSSILIIIRGHAKIKHLIGNNDVVVCHVVSTVTGDRRTEGRRTQHSEAIRPLRNSIFELEPYLSYRGNEFEFRGKRNLISLPERIFLSCCLVYMY